MPFVYSTLTSSQCYTIYKPQVADVAPPIVEAQVFIAGGANSSDAHFLTPKGVATQITDEQKQILMKCPAFVEHLKMGFVSIEDKKIDADEVAADMEARDLSAPLTPADFEVNGEDAPSTGVKKKGKK